MSKRDALVHAQDHFRQSISDAFQVTNHFKTLNYEEKGPTISFKGSINKLTNNSDDNSFRKESHFIYSKKR